MKRATLLIFLLCGLIFNCSAYEELYCRWNEAWLAPPDSSAHRKYAPDREVDILHLALEVTPDFKERSVRGEVTLRFKPNAKPLQELKLDAIDLVVESVSSSEKMVAFQGTDKNVIITFADALPPDKEATVTIKYSARPRKGLYFRTPDMGYKPEDMHLWTQGEP